MYVFLTNLEVIIDSLKDKKLIPIIEEIIEFIKTNFNAIKEEVLKSNKSARMDKMIQNVLEESLLSNA